jgi:uncharacterized protein (DUF924 family)
MTAIAEPHEVVAFWRQAGPEKWFTKDDAFDAAIRERFLATYEAAARGELAAWEAAPEPALALALVLDQFPRNMFRDSARAFAADPLARAVVRRAIARGYDLQVDARDRQFFYLPFEHSEDMADQEHGLVLFGALGDAEAEKWAKLHVDIIRKFGRFPHRNALFGRASTVEEQAFLDGGGFAG